MNIIKQKRFTVAISCTGRFLENKPLYIHAIDHGFNDGDGGQILFGTVAWPPATVAITPPLAAELLQLGLQTLSSELAKTPEQANFFVGSPITMAESLIRKAEREYPDLDPYNHFVVEKLPFLPTTRLLGSNQKIARDRMRSSLELFHALLWKSDWVEDRRFDEWRWKLQIVEHERNLFEVHLGSTAQNYLQVRNPTGRKPQIILRRRRLRERFETEHQVVGIPNDHEVDEDLFDRGLMLLLAGLETQLEQYANNWNLSGEPAQNDHGVWREGEVIMKATDKLDRDWQPTWVCCMDKFNLQSVVRECVLPTKDLWKPGNASNKMNAAMKKAKKKAEKAKEEADKVKSGARKAKKLAGDAKRASKKANEEATAVRKFEKRPHRSAKWSELKEGQVVLLVQHSSWQAAAKRPKTVRRFVMIKIIEQMNGVTRKWQPQFVHPWYVHKKGSERSGQSSTNFDFCKIKFLGFDNGERLPFPQELLDEGPLITFERFQELVKKQD